MERHRLGLVDLLAGFGLAVAGLGWLVVMAGLVADHDDALALPL
jgi:hypothetical protein